MRFTKRYLNKYNVATEAEILIGGDEFFPCLEYYIYEANESIYIQMYIIEEDVTGERIISALIEAAKRNVEIYLLLDSFATRLSKTRINNLRLLGINIRFFSPLMKSLKISMGRRLHHKVVVIDKKIAFVGGINIADRYRNLNNINGWLDFAVRVSGPVVEDVYSMCLKLWGRKFIKRKNKTKETVVTNKKGDILVRTRENDWFRKKNQISRSYKLAINGAQKEIIIVGGYFLPGRNFMSLLKNARKRNVKIKIILTKISDFKPMLLAQRFLYDFLLREGIEIYEYKPSMVHGKAIVVDSIWATIGSYNLNYLSIYSNLEFNLDIYNEKFCSEFKEKLENIIAEDCEWITEIVHKTRNKIFSRFYQFISYLFMRIIMSLMVFFTAKPVRTYKDYY